MVKIITLLALTLSTCMIGSAGVVTLDFSELPMQSVDGLSYRGVTFGFTVGGSSSADARYAYNAGIGGLVQNPNLTDPVLEGTTAGTLTLVFTRPTPFLRFDLALAFVGDGGFTVDLTGPGSPTASTTTTTTSLVVLSEGTFNYDNTLMGPPGALISQAVITFNPTTTRFALDNLSYDAPEPGTWLMLTSGLLLVGFGRSRAARSVSGK